MKAYRDYCDDSNTQDMLKRVKKSGRKLLYNKKENLGFRQQFKRLDSQLAKGEVIAAIICGLSGQGTQHLCFIFNHKDILSFYKQISNLWKYAEWFPARKEEFVKMAKAVRYSFFAFPEEQLRRYVEEKIIQKITINKHKIKEGDQLILEIDNWEDDGQLFYQKKKIGEKFKCWGRFLMRDSDSIMVGNGSGLHNSRYYIPLSKIRTVKIVSSNKSCPKGVLFLP